jgi:hypothetical protein
MNTDLDLNFLSFSGPNGGNARRSHGILVLLARLVGWGFREVWAGYVRNFDRDGGLPPVI